MLRADIEPNYQILDFYIEDLSYRMLFRGYWETLITFEKIKTRYQWKYTYFSIVRYFILNIMK